MNQSGEDGALRGHLSVRTVVAEGFTVVVAVIGATAWVVCAAKQSEIAALLTTLEGERQRSHAADLPTNAPDSAPASPTAAQANQLSDRIATLEQEKQLLVAQLGEVSRGALAPESELADRYSSWRAPMKTRELLLLRA